MNDMIPEVPQPPATVDDLEAFPTLSAVEAEFVTLDELEGEVERSA